MNHRMTFQRPSAGQFCFRLLLLGSFVASPSLGQHCPHGRIDLATLAAGMEETKDPNVILKSAAVAGPAAISVLRRISKPGMPLYTVPGAAQVSLAKLDDEKAMAELGEELTHRGLRMVKKPHPKTKSAELWKEAVAKIGPTVIKEAWHNLTPNDSWQDFYVEHKDFLAAENNFWSSFGGVRRSNGTP